MRAALPERGSLTIALAGDVMLGRLVNDSLARGAVGRPWGDVFAQLRAVDLFFVNLECALTSRTERWTDGQYKPFYFRADPAVGIAALRSAGVDLASVANNHIADFGLEGLRDTIEALDRAGIAHAGAGRDAASAREPARLTANSTRIAVVAFADYPVAWRAGEASAGINYSPISLAPEHFDNVARQLARAREGADLVVFSIHWGPNMRAAPTPEFRAFAHAVIDAGADIFWGHSAHVVQGIEFRRGRAILYDTGDLVDDYAVDERLRNDLSAVFLLTVMPPVVQELEILPVRIDDLQVNVARDRDRVWLLEQFRARCAQLGAAPAAPTSSVRPP